MLGRLLPLLQGEENLGVVEAEVICIVRVREIIQVFFVNVARQPVRRDALRLLRLLVVIRDELAHRTLSQIIGACQRRFVLRIRLRPPALWPVGLHELLELNPDLVAHPLALIRLDDVRLVGWILWVMRYFINDHPVDLDGRIPFACIEVNVRQASHEMVGLLARSMLRVIVARLVGCVDLGPRENHVAQSFILELDLVLALASSPAIYGVFLVRYDLLKSSERVIVGPGVEVTPGELVEREGVNLRNLESQGLLVGLPRLLQIVRVEEVLPHLHIGVGHKLRVRILANQLPVPADCLFFLARLVKVVGKVEEDLILAGIGRILPKDLLVKIDGLLPVEIRMAAVYLGLLQPLRSRILLIGKPLVAGVVLSHFGKIDKLALLPPELRQLKKEIRLLRTVLDFRDDLLQFRDLFIALLIGLGIAFGRREL